MLEIVILVFLVVAMVAAAQAFRKPGGAGYGSPAELSGSEPAKTRSKKASVMSVAGITHKNDWGEHRRSIICRQVREGDTVELVPEPDNSYDENAIRVLHRGDEIGYVPKAWNRRVIGTSAQVERVDGLEEVAEADGIWMDVVIDVRIRCQVK